ncbi:MAG TPA: carbohydrate ABC transporter permease, partial [Chthonomonadales bacterium]|nr:carbohydrate ABC transporter permease [Chthonomonadales bacterium]
VGRKRPKVRLALFCIALLLWTGVLLHLFPVAWMVSASLKPTREIFENPGHLLPQHPTTASYQLLFRTITQGSLNLDTAVFQYPMETYFWNSVIIATLTVLLQIPITAMAAYAVSKLHGARAGRRLFYFFIGTLMIPGQIAIVPRFLLLSHFPWPTRSVPHLPFTHLFLPSVSLVGTYWGVVVPAAFSAFNFLLLKGFFDTLPTDLIEAARIDGASELTTLRAIMLPMARPVIAVTTYFAFTGAWNDFLGPWIILMSEQGRWPLSVVMYRLQTMLMSWQPSTGSLDPAAQQLLASGVGFNALMALSVIESIPMFIAFLIFREQLMRGIQVSGLKG